MPRQKCEQLGKQPSAIRELFEFGKNRKQVIGEDNVYDFSIGNPSVPTPDIVSKTLVSLIQNTVPEKLHAYTSAQGDYNVRCKIAEFLNKKYQTNLEGKYIYLTVGAAASLTISIHGLTESGDEVVVFTPYFPEYKVFVEGANCQLVEVNCDKETFYPDLDDLKNKITSKTKIVIINSPNNPTGVVYPKEVIKELATLLKSFENKFNHPIYLLSDEPYRELIYTDFEYPFVTNYYDNSLVCYSFSKSLSLPGERIGYIVVNPKCLDVDDIYASVCGGGRMLGFICAPALFQFLIPDVLGYTSDISIYEQNLKDLRNGLESIGYRVINPGGAFYLFVEALESDAKEFSKRAKEYELLLVPSDSFGVSGFVRVSYCVTNKQIKDSLFAFKKLYDSYKKR